MSLQLIIGNKNYSSWSLRPWVFMRQNNIKFDEKRIALSTEHTDDLLSEYYSDFKVPILKDNDLEVWDSLSILEYLSENHMNGGGYPKDVKTRAFARSISNEVHSSFMNIKNELPMNCKKKFSNIELSPAAIREVNRVADIWTTCRARFGEKGEWLFGDYSIADAMFAPVTLRFAGYNIELDEQPQTYVQSVLNQPCIIDWMKQGQLEQEVIDEVEITVTGNIKAETWDL